MIPITCTEKSYFSIFSSLRHSEVYFTFRKLYIAASNAPRPLFLFPAHERWQWLEQPELCAVCAYIWSGAAPVQGSAVPLAAQLRRGSSRLSSATVHPTLTETLKRSLSFFFPPLTRLKHSYFTAVFARHPDSSLLQSTFLLHRKNMRIGRMQWNHVLTLTLPYTSAISNSEIQLWTLCSSETYPFLYTHNRSKFTAPQQ